MGINIEKSPKMAQGLFAAISLFQLSALLKLLLHIGLGSCTGTRENGSLSDEDYIRLVSHICFTLVVEETLRNTDKLLSCQVNASFCHHPLAAASTLIAAPPNGTSNSSEKTCSFTVGSAQWPSQAHVKKNTWQRNMLYHFAIILYPRPLHILPTSLQPIQGMCKMPSTKTGNLQQATPKDHMSTAGPCGNRLE